MTRVNAPQVFGAGNKLPECRRCRRAVEHVDTVLYEGRDAEGGTWIFTARCHGETEEFRIPSSELAALPFSTAISDVLPAFADLPGRWSTRTPRESPPAQQPAPRPRRPTAAEIFGSSVSAVAQRAVEGIFPPEPRTRPRNDAAADGGPIVYVFGGTRQQAEGFIHGARLLFGDSIRIRALSASYDLRQIAHPSWVAFVGTWSERPNAPEALHELARRREAFPSIRAAFISDLSFPDAWVAEFQQLLGWRERSGDSRFQREYQTEWRPAGDVFSAESFEEVDRFLADQQRNAELARRAGGLMPELPPAPPLAAKAEDLTRVGRRRIKK